MSEGLQEKTSDNSDLTSKLNFKEWTSLNDSIMGGSSIASCSVNTNGLELYGNLIEEGGGFVSCRSPIFNPPLNLAIYRGLNLEVDGDGRTLKIALFCHREFLGLNELLFDGLHWVAEFPTLSSGTSNVNIPFSSFEPTIRAKRIPIPLRLNTKVINQIQLLHSKFGKPGQLNSGFRPGNIKISLRSVSGLF